jgi:hypothetical protein
MSSYDHQRSIPSMSMSCLCLFRLTLPMMSTKSCLNRGDHSHFHDGAWRVPTNCFRHWLIHMSHALELRGPK